MRCIFCLNTQESNSIEHIVPESFGNKKYVLTKGDVCDECIGQFSKFEKTALTESIFQMERSKRGVRTKKGKNAKGRIVNLVAIEKHHKPK